MEKKIYVDGMFDADTAAKVQAAVTDVAGVKSFRVVFFVCTKQSYFKMVKDVFYLISENL